MSNARATPPVTRATSQSRNTTVAPTGDPVVSILELSSKPQRESRTDLKKSSSDLEHSMASRKRKISGTATTELTKIKREKEDVTVDADVAFPVPITAASTTVTVTSVQQLEPVAVALEPILADQSKSNELSLPTQPLPLKLRKLRVRINRRPPATAPPEPQTEQRIQERVVDARATIQPTVISIAPPAVTRNPTSTNAATSSSSSSNSGIPLESSTSDLLTFGTTKMFSFLHPSRYLRSCGQVGLDFCCPNLDGPMRAIDPNRLHAKVEVPVLELPQYLVISTKFISKQDKNLPPKVRAKLDQLVAIQAMQTTLPAPATPPATAVATVAPTAVSPAVNIVAKPVTQKKQGNLAEYMRITAESTTVTVTRVQQLEPVAVALEPVLADQSKSNELSLPTQPLPLKLRNLRVRINRRPMRIWCEEQQQQQRQQAADVTLPQTPELLTPLKSARPPPVVPPVVPQRQVQRVLTSTNAATLASTTSDLLTFGTTKMFSFLHPSLYLRSCGQVGLDFCCPNLDGPMRAIDPTRLHAKVEVPVLELPQYLVISTKFISKQDKNLPPKVRAKLDQLVAKKGLPCAIQAIQTTLPAPAATPPPTAVATVAPTAVSPAVNIVAKPVTSAPILRQKKQGNLAESTGTSSKTRTVPGMLQLPTICLTDKLRTELQSCVQLFDVKLQRLAPRAATMSASERQVIIENIVKTSSLLPNIVAVGTKLLESYVHDPAARSGPISDQDKNIIGYQHQTPNMASDTTTSQQQLHGATAKSSVPMVAQQQQVQQSRVPMKPATNQAIKMVAGNSVATPPEAGGVRAATRIGSDTSIPFRNAASPKLATAAATSSSSSSNTRITSNRNIFIVQELLSPEECIPPDTVGSPVPSDLDVEIKGEIEIEDTQILI